MFERYTEKAIKVIVIGQEEARRLGHDFVGTEQIFLGLVGEGTGLGSRILRAQGISVRSARKAVENIIGRGYGSRKGDIPFTPRAKRVLEIALNESRTLGHNYIGTEHLLLALIRDGNGVSAALFKDMNLDPQFIQNKIFDALKNDPPPVSATAPFEGSKARGIAEFGQDLTRQAIKGKMDPIIGRDQEVERVVQILGRRTKGNPILLGEPGVGKTAIAEALAQRIVRGEVPKRMKDTTIFNVDIGGIVAGTRYRGEFEERIKRLLAEAQKTKKIILVIDEIHTLIGAGAAEGAIDAANLLKPALARGTFRCIGATTLDEYKLYFEKDAALERRFQPVKVDEPSVEETVEILKGLAPKYEKHHRIHIHANAIRASAEYANKYIADRYLPDKAFDLLDEAGSRLQMFGPSLNIVEREAIKELTDHLERLQKAKNKKINFLLFEEVQKYNREIDALKREVKNKTKEFRADAKARLNGRKPTLHPQHIAEIVSAWTGIPMKQMSQTETERLLKMEDVLHSRIVGQDEAVSAVSRAIRRARVGLRDERRPISSFMFAGPTGVGKTELTKVIADYFFGSDKLLIRLDMSEYMEKHSVSRMIGSPPGYLGFNEGGELTEAIRAKPYSVVLFDEIEKAHPDINNVLLQVLEDGRLSDQKGRVVTFKNAMIVITSNVGAKVLSDYSDAELLTVEDTQTYKKIMQRRQDEADGVIVDDRTPLQKAISDYWYVPPEEQHIFEPFFRENPRAKMLTEHQKVTDLVLIELRNFFRPEFLNRIDEIVVFKILCKAEIEEILDLLLEAVADRMQTLNIGLLITDRFKDFIVEQGYDPSFGARPLRRAVTAIVEDLIADRILCRMLLPGDVAICDLRRDSKGSRIILAHDVKIRYNDSERQQHMKKLNDNFRRKARVNDLKRILDRKESIERKLTEVENERIKIEKLIAEDPPEGLSLPTMEKAEEEQ